jgi:XTP/dITP diphosphohydrolase
LTEIRLLVATTNQGKIREIKTHLKKYSFPIFSLQDLHSAPVFPEKGRTFQENARGKSLFYSQFWEGLTLAEDSGLEIVYLEGAPGVYSSRFAGPHATDLENIQKVLTLLKDAPPEKRTARFVSHMVLSQSKEIIKEIHEYVEGFIIRKKRGSSGFGYDPIFYYPPLKKTFAELTPEQKNAVSHRGRALKKLEDFFSHILHEPEEREGA